MNFKGPSQPKLFYDSTRDAGDPISQGMPIALALLYRELMFAAVCTAVAIA